MISHMTWTLSPGADGLAQTESVGTSGTCETLPALTESEAVVDLLMTEFPQTKT